MNSKKRTNAPVSSSTTEDLIALKKIKLLQQGQLKNSKRNETSNLASKINHNADKVSFKLHLLQKIKINLVSRKSYEIRQDAQRRW